MGCKYIKTHHSNNIPHFCFKLWESYVYRLLFFIAKATFWIIIRCSFHCFLVMMILPFVLKKWTIYTYPLLLHSKHLESSLLESFLFLFFLKFKNLVCLFFFLKVLKCWVSWISYMQHKLWNKIIWESLVRDWYLS